jgi:hypothetical protein
MTGRTVLDTQAIFIDKSGNTQTFRSVEFTDTKSRCKRRTLLRLYKLTTAIKPNWAFNAQRRRVQVMTGRTVLDAQAIFIDEPGDT